MLAWMLYVIMVTLLLSMGAYAVDAVRKQLPQILTLEKQLGPGGCFLTAHATVVLCEGFRASGEDSASGQRTWLTGPDNGARQAETMVLELVPREQRRCSAFQQ